MLQKKFYLPIGLCILAIVGISIFAMQSDTSKEPIKVYKHVDLSAATSDTIPDEVEKPETEASSRLETTYVASPWADKDPNEMTEAELDAENEWLDAELARLDKEREARLIRMREKDKIIEQQEAELRELRQIDKNVEELDALLNYINPIVSKMKNDYPEVYSFFERHPDATAEDIENAYPDIEDRKRFLRSAVAWDDLRIKVFSEYSARLLCISLSQMQNLTF